MITGETLVTCLSVAKYLMSVTRVEISTVLEVQIPLKFNSHGIYCTSAVQRDEPCNCTLVQNDMLLLNEYSGTKVN
uniref:Uncharacterized protein n=1 Tax=Setaria digitata TaxID=48799 RepID=A0A915Q4Y6_9BILA